jgi:hypothetical protein
VQAGETELTSTYDASALSLSLSLCQSSNLKTLVLRGNSHITIAGWQEIFQPLQPPFCMLECLILKDANLCNDSLTCLMNALANNSWLRELFIRGCDVSVAGWRAFSNAYSNILHNPISSLEKLQLYVYQLDENVSFDLLFEDVMISFARALANNNKLRELELVCSDYEREVKVYTKGYAAFTCILCNSSSILDTYCSNHTLEKLLLVDASRVELPEDLRSLVQINRENTKSQAAQLKIIQTHFGGSNINLQPFTEMDLNFMPVAISWMARDDSCHSRSLLYECVRTMMPSLLDVNSKGRKRKVQCLE